MRARGLGASDGADSRWLPIVLEVDLGGEPWRGHSTLNYMPLLKPHHASSHSSKLALKSERLDADFVLDDFSNLCTKFTPKDFVQRCKFCLKVRNIFRFKIETNL